MWLSIVFLKMGYIVVQWKNENSVSVVNEKQVVGAVALKEGRTVNVSAGTTKGRVAVYEATVLKVCGEYILRYSLRDQNLTKE